MNTSISESAPSREPNVEENTEYDYVILGGGTAGLALASRLSENPNVTILVLEAGEDRSNDPAILTPGLFPTVFGNPAYDWNYKTIPQKHADNREIFYVRGKQLGGSSAVNFMVWTHPSRKDLDDWGALGNKGWSWNEFSAYFKKTESFHPPSQQVEKELQTGFINSDVHGKDGPIATMVPDDPNPLLPAWLQTCAALGLGVNEDPRDGLALGAYMHLANVNPEDKTRSYSANTYYRSGTSYVNLDVVTDALVDKLVLDESQDGVTVKGAKWMKNGQIHTTFAKKEVILCGGVFGSPGILERSGIGNRNILESLGIRTVVDIPGVGENMQDHALLPLGLRAKPGIPTADDFKNAAVVQQALTDYATSRTGPLSILGSSSALFSLPQISPSGSLPTVPDIAGLPAGLAKQYSLIFENLSTEAISQEIILTGGWSPEHSADSTKFFNTTAEGNFVTLLGILQHPLSRGSVHITSASPTEYPRIDPNMLSHPLDLELISEIAFHMQKLAQTAPLSQLLEGDGTVFQPGYEALTDANVRPFIRRALHTENHEMGTCSMMPMELGGVVDESFRVHGVRNLRVVDVSVIPLMTRANPQSTVYALAERAAEFILGDL